MGIRKTFGFALLGITLSNIVVAEEDVYAGIKVGAGVINNTAINNANMTGFVLGYDFGDNLSVEFEKYSGNSDILITGATGTLDIDTTAIYGAWRKSYDQVFLKAKVGLLKEEIKMDITSGSFSANIEGSSTGLSYGFGAGYNISDKAILEAEYTVIEADILNLSLGLTYKF